MLAMRLASKSFTCFNEVVKSTLSCCKVCALTLSYTIRYPACNKRFCTVVPQRAVNLVSFCIDYIESLCLSEENELLLSAMKMISFHQPVKKE